MKSLVVRILQKLNLYDGAANMYMYCKYIIATILFRIKPLKIHVLTIDETIRKIKKDKMSIVRFGDGEVDLMSQREIAAYQKYDAELANYLRKVFLYTDQDFLICIPDVFTALNRYQTRSQIHWTNHLFDNRHFYRNYCSHKTFGNAFISRPYMIFKDKTNSETWFSGIKAIWENKDIVIIEGLYSRTGVGNDLFANAKSVARILCPPANAFDKFDDILAAALKVDREKLIFVALGPTAKPLAYELHKRGYHVIDIGHIDSEYEWFLRGVDEKVAIKHKHTAEISDQDLQELDDPEYSQQIIAIIR